MTGSYRLPPLGERTSQDYIIAEVLDGLAENPLFCELFCLDCPDSPRSRDRECPASYDFTDEKRCSRSSNWSDVQSRIAGGIISALKH